MRWWRELKHFPDFVKWSHSAFALPFALASLLLAEKGMPGWRLFFLVVTAVLSARVTAMAFNRLADMRWDALNPRTAGRHLPSGRMSKPVAWGIVLVGAAIFVVVSFSINRTAGCLSPAALAVVMGYSYAKRFTSWSHFVLGLALGLAPVGAWVAAKGTFWAVVPWLLASAVICWVAGFDIIYSLQDTDFDRKYGLYSMTVRLGSVRALFLVKLLHGMMLIFLILAGWAASLPWFYFAGLSPAGAALVWEHWLMRRISQSHIDKAFLQANALASFGFLAAVCLGVFL
ncbi:MAG: putative 4-hydroxybenzoate polyprenyltransferase [Verrucomicrobiae bacterium]|nr:putative 4-hydroxybenzoate polyprenyltransferase [Verrucomicrobiae bacterium]